MSDREPVDLTTTSDAGGSAAVAYQPTAAERQAAGRSRGQALIGGAAGLAVVAVLVGVFVWVQNTDDPAVAGALAPVASAPSAAEQPPPGEAPSAPAVPGQSPPPADPALATKPVVKAGTGTLTKLVVTSLVAGTGPKVAAGQTLTVNYVGVLYTSGKEFDASWKSGQPAQFPIGVGQVIKGWDQGLVGVPVGSRVQLDIPADLAYGDPAPAGYPQGALRFVVDILAAQ